MLLGERISVRQCVPFPCPHALSIKKCHHQFYSLNLVQTLIPTEVSDTEPMPILKLLHLCTYSEPMRFKYNTHKQVVHNSVPIYSQQCFNTTVITCSFWLFGMWFSIRILIGSYISNHWIWSFLGKCVLRWHHPFFKKTTISIKFFEVSGPDFGP